MRFVLGAEQVVRRTTFGCSDHASRIARPPRRHSTPNFTECFRKKRRSPGRYNLSLLFDILNIGCRPVASLHVPVAMKAGKEVEFLYEQCGVLTSLDLINLVDAAVEKSDVQFPLPGCFQLD